MLTGRESLAVTVAVCGLRARLRAVSAARPDLRTDPGAAAVLEAVEGGRQAEAARLFRSIMRERGAGPAFSLLTPAFADILAWHALTDANPFNDHAGWQVATGRAVPPEPLLGLGAAFRAFCDRGPGLPEGQSPPPASRPPHPCPHPYPHPQAHAGPVQGPVPERPGSLRGHAAVLRSHARRLRAAADAPAWRDPGLRRTVRRGHGPGMPVRHRGRRIRPGGGAARRGTPQALNAVPGTGTEPWAKGPLTAAGRSQGRPPR